MSTPTSAAPIPYQFANRVVAGLLLLSSCYFLTLAVRIACAGGGPMGFGLMLLPFLLVAITALVPAALTFTRKWGGRTFLFVLNLVALLYSMCLLYFLLSTPGTT